MSVGFDFGTTNSLVSFIAGNRAIPVLDADGLPFPSVVRYEGEKVVAGRAARAALDGAGVGIHGTTVRSPKFLLGEESVYVGGVDRNPIDIVHDVVRSVKAEALQSQHSRSLGGLTNAVVTIPVTMNGPRRAALRDAFRRSDIGIVQFVHEPLAALYGYVRGKADTGEPRRALNRRNVLVVDWGGGTLDITLCRVDDGAVTQLRNGGSDQIGGDRFDDAIRNEVMSRFLLKSGLSASLRPRPEASLRLRHDSERNKIALSSREVVTFYRPDFFLDDPSVLEYQLTRTELDEITRPLVAEGLSLIESLLESVNMGPGQISLCLVVGGMASMPAIRGRLNEMFGPQRVEIPKNSATLVSEGAAWIAHDQQRLRLAKPIELQLARGSFQTLLAAGTEMPVETEVKSTKTNFFCVDPSDGTAKFGLCTPLRISSDTQISDPRSPIGELNIRVDAAAKPFRERLELEVKIDDDLILEATATSSDVQDRSSLKFFNLEFGLHLPTADDGVGADPPPETPLPPPKFTGGLTPRANISSNTDFFLIPGEVLYKHHSELFGRGIPNANRATEEQIREHLYYRPCAMCGRRSSDKNCTCGQPSGASLAR